MTLSKYLQIPQSNSHLQSGQDSSPDKSSLAWLDRPLFILGVGKCGSSLLLALLDGHPQLSPIPEETDFFDSVYDVARRIYRLTSLDRARKVAMVARRICENTHLKNFFRGKSDSGLTGNFDYSQFDGPRFKAVLIEHLTDTYPAVGGILRAIAYAYHSCRPDPQRTEIRRWVEKTPFHQLHVETRCAILREMFADSLFVHLFRDPRNNYIAFEKKGSFSNVYDFCYEYRRAFQAFLARGGDATSMLLRYEDLVTEPRKQLEKLVAFLGLDFDESLLMPTRGGTPWHGNSMFGKKSTAIDDKDLNRFRTYQDQDKIQIVERLLHEEMDYLQYPREQLADRQANLLLPARYMATQYARICGRALKHLRQYFVYRRFLQKNLSDR